MKNTLKRIPKHLRIVVVYVMFAGLWCFFADYGIMHITNDPAMVVRLERYKIAIFILVTAALLYVECKHAYTRHAKIEERFRMMAEFTYDWEYWIGPDGHLVYVSPSCERMTGYRADEFIADPELITRILHSEDRMMLDSIHNPPEGDETATIEFRIITRDGEERWIGHVCQRVYDEHGIPMGIRVSNRDITKRKIYEEFERIQIEELFQADKMITLGTLVSGVAHEINNPTNFITLNTPLLREAWQGATPILDEYYDQEGDFYLGRFKYTVLRERMAQLFDGVTEGANRIKRIVASLKDFARPDPSDMNQKVDINLVIQNSITLLKNPISKRTKYFQVLCDENIPTLIGSSQKLEQVMINLIQNSLESLENQEKKVSVSSRYRVWSKEIVVEVEDEGCGIPHDVLSRIFDPFFTTKRTSGGTGLGLSIAARVVNEHGGKLSFSSTIGSGTRAKLVLPVKE